MFIRNLISIFFILFCLRVEPVSAAERQPVEDCTSADDVAAKMSLSSATERSCTQRCVDCLKRVGIAATIKTAQWSLFAYRWALTDTKLIPRNLIYSHFNHIKLCADNETVVTIRTYDGFLVSLPQLFLEKIQKAELRGRASFNLSHYPFATGNAVYAIYADLSGIPFEQDRFESLSINYWSEIFLLVDYFGIQEEDIKQLSFYQEVVLNHLARKAADEMVQECCRSFVGSELHKDIKCRLWTAIARYAEEKRPKEEELEEPGKVIDRKVK